MGIDFNNIAGRMKSKKLRQIAGITQRELSTNPQKSYLWEVSITNGGIIPILGTILDNIKVFAKSVTIPQEAIEPIQSTWLGEKIFHAGKDSASHTVNITFWDDEYMTVLGYMNQWFKLVRDPDTGSSVEKRDYWRDIHIKLKDSTDLITTGKVTLYNCFPIEIADINLSYESSEIIEISVTFQYDKKKILT